MRLIALGLFFFVCSVGQYPAVASSVEDYTEIMAQIASGNLSSATIFHLDAGIETRSVLHPDGLIQIGCRVELRENTFEWARLIEVLQAETPIEGGNGYPGVRWGIIFHGANNIRQEIFFGRYFGPPDDDMTVFGYVNGRKVYFRSMLPKKMLALIRDLEMVESSPSGLGCFASRRPDRQ
ncbi:hypothetical protein D3874_13280 [Oleomonas cavernae]|uniref:Uncharacterized protein n=2 Tax=Oleomonas cavernae TaxID=2320859 RepID=A0A418WCW7_9PROT|nr:hypothetical protein D3874_13280 [Oleomonas cavernae]